MSDDRRGEFDYSTWSKDFPLCPYCGHRETEPIDAEYPQEDWAESECGECEKPYFVCMEVEVTYSTKRPCEVER